MISHFFVKSFLNAKNIIIFELTATSLFRFQKVLTQNFDHKFYLKKTSYLNGIIKYSFGKIYHNFELIQDFYLQKIFIKIGLFPSNNIN
jgi:hypothetical protein